MGWCIVSFEVTNAYAVALFICSYRIGQVSSRHSSISRVIRVQCIGIRAGLSRGVHALGMAEAGRCGVHCALVRLLRFPLTICLAGFLLCVVRINW